MSTNRRCSTTAACRRLASACVAAGLLLTLGCFHPQTHTQAEEEERERILDIDTIADVTEVGNVMPMQVQGVGLVTNLDGTGGGNPPGELRKMLETELRRQKVENPKQLLEAPDKAMVIVTGFIPPGARKGDAFDVQITLPPGSKVTSLRGGYLQECYLKLFDSTKHIKPDHKGSDKLLHGHQVARASGRLIVGLNDDGAEPNLLSGVIWEGAVNFIDRPYYFLLKDKRKLAKVANAVAGRLNTMFQDDPQRRMELLKMKGLLVLDEVTSQMNSKFNNTIMTSRDTAKAINKEMVAVNVPWEYRHNTQRYILVARQLPLLESAEKRGAYRQKLKQMLSDPAQTVRAAIRLEALGKESVAAFKAELKNAHPLVRFAAAESLAYLGDSSGAAELARLAEEHYQLRAYCLTALTSLDQTVSRIQLAELLASGDKETRYGAFRALQLLNVSSADIEGVEHGHFRLHRVAPHSPGLVHYALHRRAEVVLFGQSAYLVPPFRLAAGKEFTLTAAADDKLCSITHWMVRKGTKEQGQSSLKLEEVLRTLAEMGADYADVVGLLRQVEDHKCLNCAVCVNALPQPTDVDVLAKSGTKAEQWGLAPAAKRSPGDGSAVTRPAGAKAPALSVVSDQ